MALSAIAVYCGSSPGADPAFAEAAASFGRQLAERGITLVYGGAQVGLMGTVADAVLERGGEVHGVITRALRDKKEVAHPGLTSLRVVETMHERKAVMAAAADAFVMLPGGLGTFEEFFEALSWTTLGIHAKPCGVLDVGGFCGPLRALLDGAVTSGFVRPEHRDVVLIDSGPARLLDRLASWSPVSVPKRLDPEQGPLVRELGPGDWEAMRDVRLAALRDAPHAFGSTYAREAAFAEEQWRARFHDRGVTYLAYLAESPAEPAGIAGVLETDGTAEVVSMWVRSSARGRGIGETLITACAGWARKRGHGTLYLWVTESNDPARRLYERCGFTSTGQRQPLPSNPSLPEIRLRRDLLLCCLCPRSRRWLTGLRSGSCAGGAA